MLISNYSMIVSLIGEMFSERIRCVLLIVSFWIRHKNLPDGAVFNSINITASPLLRVPYLVTGSPSYFLCFWLCARGLCCLVWSRHCGGWVGGWCLLQMNVGSMWGGILWEIKSLLFLLFSTLYIQPKLFYYKATHGVTSN